MGATFQPRQRNWRWYTDATPDTSMSALANENAKPTLVDNGNIIRLRVTIAEIGGKADTNYTIAAQYDTDPGFSSPQSFGAAPQHWNYADGAGPQGDTVDTQLLSDATTKNEYCEGANAVSIAASSANEIDIAIQATASVSGDTTYYFRIVGDGTAIALDSGETYPQVLTAAALLTKALADTITLSDSIVKAAATAKADTVSLSDTLAKKSQVPMADTITLSDAIAKKPGKALGDTITLTDEFSRIVAFVRELGDTITLSDGVSKTISIPLSDTITLSDEVTFRKILNLQLSDTITLSDVVAKKPKVILADEVTLSDQLAKHVGKVQADSIVLSDAVYNAVKLARAGAITLSDEISKGISIQLADTITLTEDIAKKIAKAVTDQISLFDLFSSVLTLGGGITVFAFTEAETGEEYYLVNDKFITKEGGGKAVTFAALPVIMFEVETGEVFLVINQNFISKTRGESHEN